MSEALDTQPLDEGEALAVPLADLRPALEAVLMVADQPLDESVLASAVGYPVAQVRDAVAARLDLDPGVLCSRDRLETIARRRPTTLDALAEVPDLRRWQIAELGAGLLDALRAPGSPPGSRSESPSGSERSPYRDR